jgi:hypothetical protein
MTLRARKLRFSPFLFVLFAASCGGSQDHAKGPGDTSLPLMPEHEACDTNSPGAQKIDSNGDGRPDIVRVMSGGRETCRMVDLNHDGKPDTFVYFDGNGAIRRTESDFDRDGVTDEIAHYAGGVVIRKDRETNLDKRLDTWDFYQGGKIQQRLRDSDANGKVDQWWTWPNPDRIECAVIASDHDGDGQPDPGSVVDVCSIGDGGAAPPATAAKAAGADAAPAPAPPKAEVVDAGGSSAADAGVAAVGEQTDAGGPKKRPRRAKKDAK